MGVPIHLAAEWHVLSPLLDEALDLPTGDRAAWLANLSQEHRRLRTALSALLAGDALECAPADTIGPWRLIEKIGEGGMAEVWLAGRSDGLLARPVALKLPRSGWGNRLFCARLAREREILDSLNHPNIARLLDAGAASNGQPYLVLEYVEGKRIDEYCRERRLSAGARLELFLQVTKAIAFAHRSLVLHRDLKPSNILVTSEGEVRVLDFGIAKLLELGQTEETDLTQCAGRTFTLDYASPEQIAGQPLTVASDVYSLGIVLYELLTGVRPYSLNPKSAAALEAQILEVQPPPPSEIAAEKEVHRALRGDLDHVILMALNKLPEARYASVEALAEDLQRYLQRRPVLAQSARPWRRASMCLRRHWLAFLTGALLLSILAATSALTTWQARVALARAKQAEEAKAMVISMLFDAHAYKGGGKQVSALDLLRQTQQRLATLPTADVRSRVQVLNILGASLLSQQDTHHAEAAADRAMTEAGVLSPADPERLRSRLLRSWVLLSRGQTDKVHDRDRAVCWKTCAGTGPRCRKISRAPGASARRSPSRREIRQRRYRRHWRRCESQSPALVRATINRFSPWSISAMHTSLPARRRLALQTGEKAVMRALEAYAKSATHPNVLKARVALGHALANSGQLARGIQLTQDAIEDAIALFSARHPVSSVSI